MREIERSEKMPLISIITVCFNARDVIEKTIESVINQSYSLKEYIIIDGGSSDGTVNIVRQYIDKISYFVSEPDKGIYDAMNKAIKIATGDWINFMNAGDVFLDTEVLTNLSGKLDRRFSFVYGNTICDYSGILIHRIPDDINCMQKHLPFSHQSVFIKSDYHKKHLYDISYKVTADYNMFYQAYQDGEAFKYVNLDISIYEAEDGVSSNSYKTLYLEYAYIHGDVGARFFKYKYAIIVMWQQIKQLFKSFMPRLLKKYYYHIRLEKI